MLGTTVNKEKPTVLDFSSAEINTSHSDNTKYYKTKVSQLNKNWQTSALLQTTLDLSSMLNIFSIEVANSIGHSGIIYKHKESQTNIIIGRETKQKCSFKLVLEKQKLGELIFMSGKPFTQKKRAELEFLLSSLIYPLRNALQYLVVCQSSVTDPLTGINNRNILNTTLKHQVGLYHRYKTPLSLLVIDVDCFKKINDVHGHECGDRVIQSVADTILACLRETDTLVRYGGDEFVVVLSNTSLGGAYNVCEHISRYASKYSS